MTFERPRSLTHALELREAHPTWRVLAGGTDLLVHGHRQPVPAGVIDLWGLPELCGLHLDDTHATFGAGLTWHDVHSHPWVQARLPSLTAAAREIGALQIQMRATIGGNIATSSPVGDSLPVWLALGAEILLASQRGQRRMPYADFLLGYRRTALAADELIVGLRVPLPSPTARVFFRKVGTRRAQSISKVMAAAAIDVRSGVIHAARMALGAVADRPIRVPAAEAAALGLSANDSTDRVHAAVVASITPITDVRSDAAYRRDTAGRLLARYCAEALTRPSAG